MNTLNEFSFPTHIIFGPGARKRMGETLRSRSLKRPLLVTDQGITSLPMTAEICELIAAGNCDVRKFDGVQGNPIYSQVQAGLQAYRDHNADCIIALGGGAPVDVSKAVAVMVNHPGSLFDYEDRSDAKPIDKPVPPILAVPTTAGTGSEVGRSTVISEDDTHVKRIIFSPKLLPNPVFADPELLLALPASITAATGMDALTHLVEARLARGYHPMCDGIAIEGLRMVARNLRACVDYARNGTGATPEHLTARGEMLLASIMGAVAFQKGLGVTHSLAHSLSTVKDMHHGLANGIMISYAMAFNAADASLQPVFRIMAQAVGAPEESAGGFLRWIDELREAIGIPTGLAGQGVTDADLENLTRFAFQDGCHQLNPRTVSADDLRNMYAQSLRV
ncbi:MAG: iron-containing alcohol dehydrogenase [Leptospiraceae bacterium]|nr:iron-containing alcohol dehydrogenase [Leptospiraceae bacterium]